ncbi:bifunctional diaminohydroxyphosphoribosylaminopyrimidine deaminase/5-amino-6-(5-phosphoribosylamino)uracil reductase RibD [Candidatus Sumerlaeota bacterium]|nr:bifunctional diaminohydroxyphosphoribosylaminopyrimidine deaminase/5-amino-6-(5-phosphoribosylamino)uracil reductase RibD [Candidatus Sumerlaeota bacterium]
MGRFTKQDEQYMRRALELAREHLGQTHPNPVVGCVIVKEDRIIGEGAHTKAGRPHAEIEALKNVKEDPRGAKVYLNLEPCTHKGRTPPCAPKLIEAGIREAVIAMEDPNPIVHGRGIKALRDAGVRVKTGLMEDEARVLNEAFVTYHTKNRPFIVVKWAMTLDGRMSSDSGSSKWISNNTSREYVHRIRSQMDAIMVGIGTVIKDNPRLNVRLDGYEGRQPHRVIVDGFLRIPLRSRCLQLDGGGPALILTGASTRLERRKRALREFGHTVLECKSKHGFIDVYEIFQKLHDANIQSVMIEGGSQLQTSIFEEGLFDKLICFIAPKIIGGRNMRNPIEGGGIEDMKNAIELEQIVIRNFEDDVCIEGYRIN